MKRNLGRLGLLWALALPVFLLSACGGGGGGGTSQGGAASDVVLSGIAADGPINGGTVNIYALDSGGNKGRLLATAETDKDGHYKADLGPYSGNLVVEVTGGTYTDDASGDTGDNHLMRAVVAGISGNVSGAVTNESVSITPLTEIATRYAEAKGGETTDNINAGNNMVSDVAGVNIITTPPAAITNTQAVDGADADSANYGLALDAISQMAAGGSIGVDNAVSEITNDLATNSSLKATGDILNSSLDNFCASHGIAGCSQTGLANSISFMTGNQINPFTNATGLDNAKGLIADARNTALSIYNYQGYGMPGIINTSLTDISRKLPATFGADVQRQVQITGLVLSDMSSYVTNSTAQVSSGGYEINFTGPSTLQGQTTANFTILDSISQVREGSGTISSIQYDSYGNPVSGTVSISSLTANPLSPAQSTFSFNAATSNGLYTNLTMTGSMTNAYDGVSADFSKSGRQLYVTFGQMNGSTSKAATYMASISFGGEVIINGLAQFDGTLSIPTLVINEPAGTSGGTESFPSALAFSGTLQQLDANNNASGATFTGSLDVTSGNIGAYSFDSPESATNFLEFTGTFTGTISAPDRPVITATIGVSSSAYKQYSLSFSYKRTNTDGTIVSLSGDGTYDGSTKVLQATLTNQNSLNVNLSYNESNKQFSGTIDTTGGTNLANFELISNMPVVKFADGYVESVF